MKLIKQLTLAIAMMAAGATNVQAQNVKVPHAYMFGFVASFNDSTVYFTNIQQVDSVWVTKKKKMLAGRNNYSYQLREFFAQKRNMPNRTCVVVANTDRKKVEKKYIKMKNKYLVKSKKPYDVRNIADSDFKFSAVDMSNE
ncbi:MAG: hypothetical protein E7101_01585 [Prevotella ruminicola]|jgi:hypothetical protein|uniref:DUF3108 domain-containing protein n=1 Tax=Xylanibacter ruminicola TaxID=839 RepID=A0A9D5S6D2_XYLRU|nr:hypothetical protein [Xylanibacter ruminicola]